MSNARFVLVALICASPAIMLLDGPIMQGLVAGFAAAGIAIVARSMRTGETEFLISAVARQIAIAAVPAAWMLVQVFSLKGAAHPIWESAEVAFGRPVGSSISVDTGNTVMALGQYLSCLAVALLSAAVAVQRERAEWILLALTGASALMALILVTHDLFGLGFLNSEAAAFERSQVVDCVAIGMIISATAAIRSVERLETRKNHPERSVPVLLLTLTASAAIAVVCLVSLIHGADGRVLVAVAYGFAVLGSVVVIRRIGLGPWGIAAIAVSAGAVAIVMIVLQPATRSFPLAFAAPSQPFIAATQRMLDDAPATGVGAGGFAAISPIYQNADDSTAALSAPTAAAAIAIELGQPMLWIIVVAIAATIVALVRASLRRGRDSFYPAAGGGCLLTLLLLGFINAGVLGTAAAVVATATVGLAFAQSKSRMMAH